MRILSFDTSNPILTVALMEHGKIVSSRRVVPPESSRQEAVSQLMPNIDGITSECNWSRESIDLIVVGVGPGSFTGIRTSVVTARTLAQILDIALIGADTLRSYAAVLALPAAIVLSGGRGHYFIGSYAAANGKEHWQSGDPPMDCRFEPCCVLEKDLVDVLRDVNRCFVEDKILDEIKAICPRAETIDKGVNLAAIQAELVWNDFSLCNENREALRANYSYEKVNPLYLRGASITMKPANAGNPSSTRN